MASNTPDRPEHPDHDPAHPDEPQLGPVEPLDAFDDGLILTGDGVAAPPGVPVDEESPEGGGDDPLDLADVPMGEPVDDPAAVPHSAQDPDAAVGGPATPTTPASGWLESGGLNAAAPPSEQPRSTADIDLLPVRRAGEEPSDIFSTARGGGGSDALLGSGSDLRFGGSDAPLGSGSDLRFDRAPVAGGSDLGPEGPDERGSSLFDEPSRVTDRVEFEDDRSAVAHPEVSGRIPVGDEDDADEEFIPTDPNLTLPSDDPAGVSGFDRVDKDSSGSDLFGDATIVDVNLLAEAGMSGINLLDPDADPGEADAESASSIFSKTGYEPSDGGRVDMDAIPLMEGGDERTESMFDPGEAGNVADLFGGAGDPDQPSAVSFDLGDRHGSQDALADFQDSANINWANPPGGDGGSDPDQTFGPGQSAGGADVTAADLAMDALDDSSSGGGDAKGPVDDESVFSMPSPRVVADPGLSAVLNEAAAAAKAPGSRPAISGPTTREKISLTGKVRPPAVPATTARSAPKAEPVRAGRGRLLAGALGVLAGAGVGAAGMYFASGDGGSGPAKGVVPGGPRPGLAAAQSVEKPTAEQVAADPGAALRAFEQLGESPEVKAGRGQARWLAKVRQAAGGGIDRNDPEVARARADLQAAADAAGQAKTPVERQSAMRAALYLGLIHEATGEPAEAEAVYRKAKEAMPAFGRVFDTALVRVGVLTRGAGGRQTRLAPADAADLAGAVILLDFPPVQQLDDEPGFHFWEAVNAAATPGDPGAFDRAIRAIDEARKVHEARRQKYAGMGLNPLSDPAEQIFPRACDEMKRYWALQAQLYADPAGRALAAKGGTRGAVAELLKAKAAMADDAAALARAQDTLRTLSAKLDEAQKAIDRRTREIPEEIAKAAREARAEADKNVAAATERLAAKAKEAAAAKAELATADRKLKAAEAAVDLVVEKLKEVKLIDPAADRAAAAAALPAAVKKAVVVTGKDSQVAELAASLDDAKKARAEAERKAAAATAALADAQGDAAKKIAALEDAAKGFGEKLAAEVQRAAAAARAEARAKLDAAAAELSRSAADRAADAKRFEDRLAAQAEQFRQQLTAVRSGAAVPLADVERVTQDRARRAYAAGIDAYQGGLYTTAEGWFARAVQDDPADARYWYFLGLAKWAQGRAGDADADFRKGAEWEARARPGRRAVGEALLKVQGSARAAVDAYRP